MEASDVANIVNAKCTAADPVERYRALCLAGDFEAGVGVPVSLPNEDRGEAARWVLEAYVEGLISRELAWLEFEGAWSTDHEHVLGAFGSDRRRIARAFEILAPAPSDLPEAVEIYRGTASAHWRASRGLSWTRRPEQALFFAHHWQDCRSRLARAAVGAPTVWRAIVPREWIAAVLVGRDEDEIILNVDGLNGISASRVCLAALEA